MDGLSITRSRAGVVDTSWFGTRLLAGLAPAGGDTCRAPYYLRKPYGLGWALVGDAGCNKDSITGQRIHDAFRDAEPPPPELLMLLAAMPGNQDAMDGFARVNAGVTLPAQCVSQENVEWIMSQSEAVTAVH
jgi:hypothetical protein